MLQIYSAYKTADTFVQASPYQITEAPPLHPLSKHMRISFLSPLRLRPTARIFPINLLSTLVSHSPALSSQSKQFTWAKIFAFRSPIYAPCFVPLARHAVAAKMREGGPCNITLLLWRLGTRSRCFLGFLLVYRHQPSNGLYNSTIICEKAPSRRSRRQVVSD